jgi:PAS domain S-box-containing protein
MVRWRWASATRRDDRYRGSNPAGTFTRTLIDEGVRGAPWIGYIGAIALVGAAVAARFALLPVDGGLVFNTLYPAVILSALFFGVGPGLLATVLSATCADYYFLPPFMTFSLERGYVVSIVFYLATCGLTCFLVHRLRHSVRRSRATENKLRALYEASNVGIVLTDMNTRYVDFNETFRRFTGYSADELRTLSYRALTAENDRASTDEQLELAKRTGHFGPYEKDYIRKDGSRIPLRFNGALFTDIDGQSYLWSVVDDITDRRRLERALLDSTSAEQQKLGRDLHDGLGQELSGIALLAAAIAQSIKKAGRQEAAELENLAKITSQAVANCRAIAHGLSPVTFADGGLVEVLNEMVALHRNSFGVNARCEVTEAAPLRLRPDVLENLYRISQEGIANARRHGRAKSIKVRLDIQPTAVRLDVLDDGIGLPLSTTQSTGMGFKIMQFRAGIIGARLSIGPGDEGGTLVSVECPQPP